VLPHAGEYTVEVIARGLARIPREHAPEIALDDGNAWLAATARRRDDAAQALVRRLPARPPQFCIGVPSGPCSRR
jgi:TPP-dependent indolepyruvate ferredoxin oxidoreductase alpha subunit